MVAYFESDTPSTPSTPTTLASEALIEEISGLICPIGRKTAKRKAKEQVADPVLDLVTKEMLTLRATNVKNSTMSEPVSYTHLTLPTKRIV